jgi:DNA-binding HxlR family transcriptional regulator
MSINARLSSAIHCTKNLLCIWRLIHIQYTSKFSIYSQCTYFLHVALLASEQKTWYTKRNKTLIANDQRDEKKYRQKVAGFRIEMAGKSMATKLTTESSTSITQACPRYEHAIQILGKRWTGLLLNALMDGPRRFCELTSLVDGLSDRVLSDRLRELEAEDIVKRVVYPNIPVRVEYQLTAKGLALKPVIDAIHQWAQEWIALPDSATITELQGD